MNDQDLERAKRCIADARAGNPLDDYTLEEQVSAFKQIVIEQNITIYAEREKCRQLRDELDAVRCEEQQ